MYVSGPVSETNDFYSFSDDYVRHMNCNCFFLCWWQKINSSFPKNRNVVIREFIGPKTDPCYFAVLASGLFITPENRKGSVIYTSMALGYQHSFPYELYILNGKTACRRPRIPNGKISSEDAIDVACIRLPAGLTLKALKNFRSSHGDQSVFLNLKSS